MAAVTDGVEETIKELKKIPGFSSYLIINNDGIVIKYENMSLKTAIHYASLVLALASKATKYIKELFEAPDVSSIALLMNWYALQWLMVLYFPPSLLSPFPVVDLLLLTYIFILPLRCITLPTERCWFHSVTDSRIWNDSGTTWEFYNHCYTG